MAEYHEIGVGKHPPHPAHPPGRLPAVVHHRHAQPAKIELRDIRRTPGGHVRPVVVPAHRVHRRIPGKLVQDLGRAHVPRVQDHIRPPQVRGHPERARLPPARRMRIGKDDNPHPAILPDRASGMTATARRTPGQTRRAGAAERYDLRHAAGRAALPGLRPGWDRPVKAKAPGGPGKLLEPWFAPLALVNGSAVGLTPILLPLVAAKQGAGHVGLVMGTFNLGAFAAPVTGGVADALHAHRLLATLCAALSAVSLWLFPFANSPLQLLLALVNGAGFAGAVTIANLMIVERRPEPEWNQRLGWLETALSVGQGGALILAAWLSGLGERAGLGIAALIPAAAVPLCIALLPRSPTRPQPAATADQTGPHAATADQRGPAPAADQTEPHAATADQTEPHAATADQTEPQAAAADQTEPHAATADQRGPAPAADQTEPQAATADQPGPHAATADQRGPAPAADQTGLDAAVAGHTGPDAGLAQAVPAAQRATPAPKAATAGIPGKPGPAAQSALRRTASVHRLRNAGHTGEWGPVSPSGLPHVPGTRKPLLAIGKSLGLLHGGFGWMLAAWIPAYAGSAIVFALYPVLFQHAFHVKPQTSSLAFAIIVFVSLPLFIVAGRVSQRRGPRAVMAGGLGARVVLLAILAILAASGSIPAAAPLAVFGGILFAWSFLSVASPGLTGQFVPQAEGEAQGVLNAASGVAGFAGAVIGGAVASAAGYPAALTLGAAATALGLLIFTVKFLRPRKST